MKQCPIDGTQLKIIERQGVQIDLCPRCQGVWLDRDELDKIIEAAYALPATAPPGQDPPAVGVWADSIQSAPVPAPPPVQPPIQPQPSTTPQPSYPQQNQPAPPDPVQALSDLLSGLATVHPVSQGHIQPGQGRPGRRRPRGWLEQMFDIDLD